MSAFVVSDKHISALVAHLLPVERQEMGQKLVNENYRSVNYRYHSNDKPHVFQFEDVKCTAVELIKLCRCYNYQCCETPDWKETDAYRFVEKVQFACFMKIRDIIPGYEEAEWTI